MVAWGLAAVTRAPLLTAPSTTHATHAFLALLASTLTPSPLQLRAPLTAAPLPPRHARWLGSYAAGGRAFPWQGYRLVVEIDGSRGGIGQYYGIQGTSWKDPPVLKMTTDTVRLAGRDYRIEYDDKRIRRLIWTTPNGTYWVNNSLKNSLSNSEMRAIARSLVPYRP